MRITVDLDDDILLAVQAQARRDRQSVGEALSELARQALTDGVPAQRAEGRHGFHPLPSRGRPVSNALTDRLREGG